MDAISFVMGEKTSSLRVKRLSDLIHGASINKPVSHSASVTAVFILDNGQEKSFQRAVKGSSSECRINGDVIFFYLISRCICTIWNFQVVSNAMYLSELEKLNINVKGKNFLVFQGQVESVAMKSPKEMTTLFEEISGYIIYVKIIHCNFTSCKFYFFK